MHSATKILLGVLAYPLAAASQEESGQEFSTKEKREGNDKEREVASVEIPWEPLLQEEITRANKEGETPLRLLAKLACENQNNHLLLQQLEEPLAVMLVRQRREVFQRDRLGQDAIYLLFGAPELMQRLRERGVLPRLLPYRFPKEPGAAKRAVSTLAALAEGKNTPEQKNYLRVCYLSPNYDQVLSMLKEEIHRPTGNNGNLRSYLSFLREAEPVKAESYINSLPLWEHSEHFLEEPPMNLLRELHNLHWQVTASRLKTALEKLERMLPHSQDDMIECDAAKPMAYLLDMLIEQQGAEQSQAWIKRCAASFDPELSTCALNHLLRMKGLPDCLHHDRTASPTLQRLRHCVLDVDKALLQSGGENIPANDLQQAAETCRMLQLYEHASILERLCLLAEEKGNDEREAAARLREEYRNLTGRTPTTEAARYILNHPSEFYPTPSADAYVPTGDES